MCKNFRGVEREKRGERGNNALHHYFCLHNTHQLSWQKQSTWLLWFTMISDVIPPVNWPFLSIALNTAACVFGHRFCRLDDNREKGAHTHHIHAHFNNKPVLLVQKALKIKASATFMTSSSRDPCLKGFLENLLCHKWSVNEPATHCSDKNLKVHLEQMGPYWLQNHQRATCYLTVLLVPFELCQSLISMCSWIKCCSSGPCMCDRIECIAWKSDDIPREDSTLSTIHFQTSPVEFRNFSSSRLFSVLTRNRKA